MSEKTLSPMLKYACYQKAPSSLAKPAAFRWNEGGLGVVKGWFHEATTFLKRVDNQSSLVSDVQRLMVNDRLDIGIVLVDDQTSFLIFGRQEKYLSW